MSIYVRLAIWYTEHRVPFAHMIRIPKGAIA